MITINDVSKELTQEEINDGFVTRLDELIDLAEAVVEGGHGNVLTMNFLAGIREVRETLYSENEEMKLTQ